VNFENLLGNIGRTSPYPSLKERGERSIMIRFLPKEEKFFEMLKKSAQNLLKGAEALKELVENYTDVERKVKEIKEIEHQGDKIFHQIVESLNKTFVTPLDREDIHQLASELDDVLDAIEGISSRLLFFKIEKPTLECIQLVNIIYKATVEIEKAVADLKHFKNLHPFCVEINSLENEADQISQTMIGILLDAETDWRKAIKWKEIYGRLETAADHCEDIANVIETIVVKNA
jgi:predicted phosphate transport protein (TIGR00153 family)